MVIFYSLHFFLWQVDETYTNHARITCVLPLDNSALVGTADGTLVVYDVVARKSPSPSAPSSPRPPQGGPEPGHAKQIQERLQVSASTFCHLENHCIV